MPSADERLAILQMTIEKLIDAGYEYIGMDHFAKPTDELAIAQAKRHSVPQLPGIFDKGGLRCLRVWRLGDQPVREYLRAES